MKSLPAKKLLLAGAGHAHIGLLRRLSTERSDNIDITLVTEQLQFVYSGMLPGWMAGHYHLDDITIDVTSLCEQSSVRFIQHPIAKVEAASCTVTTTNNEIINYDVLSLNTGADTDTRWLHAAATTQKTAQTTATTLKDDTDTDTDTVIAIRPLSKFIDRWQQILVDAYKSTHYRLAIVGAGAAATELVMSAQIALQRINPKHQVYLVCGEHLLSGFNSQFRRRVINQFKRHSIIVVYARATSYNEGQLLTTQESLEVDTVIAATGVMGAEWTQHTDLETINNGFVAVNATQQSISHLNVFAVGDVATRVDQSVAHSGVHAVYGGAVVADNLLSYLEDKPTQEYQPRTRTLYLLSCGDKYAIASWGSISLQGRWLWYLKQFIDKRFVKS
ncbi:NADH dehydrogenase FAD-containing subunit [Psychrobacter sp. PL19]|uniref:FAD-dependent oxidoreductase n=1 Tax=Psychrobacter sp. PL19 TaxID=2760711 RepID=UPI001AE8033A